MNSNDTIQNTTPEGTNLLISVDDKRLTLQDPIPIGRQILALAGKHPVEEHLLYALGTDNVLEDISLDEGVDLRKPGIERFLTFKADRSFRFELNGKRQDWGAPKISEETIRKLAAVDDCHRVFLERQGEPDRLIERGEFLDLTAPGIERLYTKQIFMITVVNEDDGREIKMEAEPDTGIETLIARLYTKFGVERRGDDRLRCEQDGSDVFAHATETIGKYLASFCGCLVWLFAGGTGGASCR